MDVSGTGEPGDAVLVTIGDLTQTTIIGVDGTWVVTFPGTGLPADGDYSAIVVVTTTIGTTVTLDGPDFLIDMTPPEVVVTEGTQSVGDIENLADYADGVTIAGTGEIGATVNVQIGVTVYTVVVPASGSWSVTFSQSEVAGGEYQVPVLITATDPLGNVTTLTDVLVVDTVPHPITFDAVTADNTVNGAESGGFTVTGTSTAGATIAVTLAGVTQTAVVAADGSWSVSYGGGVVADGAYTASLTATTTDAAGNVSSASHAFEVDTSTSVSFHTPVEGDGTVNAVEATDGVMLSGSSEPGSTVVVSWNGKTLTAESGPGGYWTATFPAAGIVGGTYDKTAVVTATDAAGNSASANLVVHVDTEVINFARTGGEIAGDGMVNADEAAGGVNFHGTVEANSTVVVTLSNGSSVTTTATADGLWSATFSSDAMPRGELDASVTVQATDPVGNVASFTEGFVIDTVAPGSPEVVSFTRDASGLRGIGTESTDDTYTFTTVDEDGTIGTVDAVRTENQFFDESTFRFAETVPDGTYLVINTEDLAGNASSTLLIVDNTSAPDVDLDRAGLSGFDFSTIDLTFAPEAELSISEDQILALTGADRQLMVKGDADDMVNLIGGIDSGTTTQIDGDVYRLYTLGDSGASVLIDDDITTTTSVI